MKWLLPVFVAGATVLSVFALVRLRRMETHATPDTMMIAAVVR